MLERAVMVGATKGGATVMSKSSVRETFPSELVAVMTTEPVVSPENEAFNLMTVSVEPLTVTDTSDDADDGA